VRDRIPFIPFIPFIPVHDFNCGNVYPAHTGCMKQFFLVFALLAVGLACHKPEATPTPAKLVVHFLDQDAVVGLDRPVPGTWSFMDAGRWAPVDTIWTGREGRAAVGRTAPKWVLLQDPDGGIHRVELSNEPDPIRSDFGDRESSEDQAAGLFVVWLWLSQVITGR